MPFDRAFALVIGVEGGYSNNPADSGGETMWGVTKRKAQAHGYMGDMRSLTKDFAMQIYKSDFWDWLKLDEIDRVSPKIAYELFDTGVNAGVGAAGKFLQRALNVLNRNGKDYSDITVDGAIGPATLAAFNSYVRTRKLEGEIVLLRILNCMQGAHYINLAEERSKDEAFIFGWFRTRVVI